jgi:PKD repeat protein
MKAMTILGVIALVMLLVLPGAVSAADVQVSGSIAQPAPVAAFTISPQTGTTPLLVTFTDTSTVSLGTIDSWMWEYRVTGTDTWNPFTDSTEQNPIQEFTTGIYDIRHTVSAGGVSDDEIKLRCIAVSAGPKRLTTVQSGTVSGDMSVQAFGHFTTTTSYVVNTDEDTFTLPAAAVGNVQWARLYIVVFGSHTDNREGTAVVSFDGNGDGIYETTLGTETMAIPSDSTANVYAVNDHVDKQYLNYQIQYDVTSLITSTSPKAKVVVTPVTSNFDGRINGVTLVVAYNDGDSDVVKYWVNDGFDFQPSTASAVTTTFDTDALPSDLATATLTNVHLSTKDATYTFNTNSLTNSGTGIPSFGTNVWDVKDYMTTGSDASLSYAHASGSSFKTTLAALKVKLGVPTAAFTYSPTTVIRGSPVSFDASTSTGSITSYTWDFAGTAGSGITASHTFDTTGDKVVKLTVSGPGGSNYIEQTITVKEPAPNIDFSASKTDPMVGESITFTGTNIGGAVTTWAWDFGDGTTGSGQVATHAYTTAGTRTVTLTATGPDYTDVESKPNYITVGAASIDVSVTDAAIDFGTMAAGVDETGSTTVNGDVTYGTAWSVTAAANNGGYMKAGALQLESPFQLSNGGLFSPMTSNFANFLTGAAGVDGSGPANVKQVIAPADAPGAYSVTLTFTGQFEI